MSGRRRSTRRLKAALAGLIVVGGVSCLTISGTYAVFTSQESHVTNKVTSGTLLLSNSVTVNGTTTACTSYGTGSSGDVNPSCTALVPSSTYEYPGSTATAQVAITDSGTLDGLTLSLYMPTCTNPVESPAAGKIGGGNPCTAITDSGTPDGLQLVIQETNSSWSPTTCWYPVSASGTCSAASGYAAAAPNSFGSFAQQLKSTGHALSLGSGPTAGATRYFLVSVLMPSNGSTSLEGEEALFNLTWHLAD